MPVFIAAQTITAIENQLTSDGGNKYRAIMKDLIIAADEPFRQAKDGFRSHFGYSRAGEKCERNLYYAWHWAARKQISGRIQRLFNRGHLEEPRMVAALMAIGCQVWAADEQGNQFRVSDFGGHSGSAIDGVVLGIPEAPKLPVLAEFKTHGDKSFVKLAGKNYNKYVEWLLNPQLPKEEFTGDGVRESKFEHYVQMQIYMHKKQLTGGLYMACNKNDDAIYCELVEYDQPTAERFIDRTRKIIFTNTAPAGIPGAGPGNFYCKSFCDFYDVCQRGGEPERNCRTCSRSLPNEDGTWSCAYHSRILSSEDQAVGCGAWDRLAVFK